MALGSIMLQLDAFQQLDQDVSTVEPFFAEVFEFLSLGTVTVREISMEKEGGVAGKGGATPVDFSTTGFASLRLLFPSSKEEVRFFAPSFVPSPPVTGAGLVLLEVEDVGVTASGNTLQVVRRFGVHAYLDEA